MARGGSGRAMNGAHEHRIGKYLVRTEWRNNVLYYDIFRNGLLYNCGFDRLSISEDLALQAIRERNGYKRGKHADYLYSGNDDH